MDYEKKYKEALERAKKAQQYDDCNVVPYIFPELKESEDEKIRKELICFLETEIPQCNARDKYIAWLEEQKEFVSADFDDVWETADCDELTAPLEKYSKDAIKKMCHAWYDKGIELERRNWLEKQGEQKPQGKTALEAINEEKVDNANKVENEIEIPYGAKDSELIEESYNIPKGFHAEIDKDKVVIKKGEKPAWSEEDEEILNLIIARLQSHPDVDLEEYSKEYDWLNSPKARSTWKPSDAQMDALEHFVRSIGESGYASLCDSNTKLIYSLLDQLKKL